ncbi:autotransporter domain-containing protein [Chelatococcus sp. GCM10030263]|uniref:autotransporter domain-containing protein n=1 Tax=Chelatococcus sp. GCM10030263 TaxID=3273387 RepID=UPI00360B3BF8
MSDTANTLRRQFKRTLIVSTFSVALMASVAARGAFAANYTAANEAEFQARVAQANNDGDPSSTITLIAPVTLTDPAASLGASTKPLIIDTAGSVLSVLTQSGTVTYSGGIVGAGAFTQGGPGTSILTGNNTYTGGTTIAAGTLQLGNGGTSGAIIGNVTNNDTLAFDRSNSYTFGDVISGSGTVKQIGAGTTILIGNNSYSGGTQVRGGTLVAQAGNAIGDLSSVFVFDGGTFRVADDETVATLAGGGGTVDLDGADLTLASTFANVTSSYPGSITGTGGLVKQGAFEQVLSGNNSYQGATQILGGTLYAVGAGINSIPDTSAVTVAAGATLSLVQPFPPFAGEESDDETIGSLAGAGHVDLGAQVLTIGGNDANTTFSGVIAGVGGSLVKTGSGTTVLSGANTYTGPTTVAAGTLQAGAANAFSQASGTTVEGGGTLDLGGFVQAIDTVSLAGGTLQNGALAGAVTSTGGTVADLGGSASLTTLSGLTTVLGTNTYTGGTTINGGVLQLGDGGTSGTITGDVVNNGTLAFDRSDLFTFDGAISGSGAVNQIGSGTTVLSGINSYTGATTIDAGTLKGGAANSFSQASATTIESGATLDLGGFAQAIDSVSLAGGTLQNGALAGAVTSTGGTVAGLGGSASLTTQAGITTVQGTNSYTGPTTVAGGMLVVGDDAHAGASLVSAVTVNSGGTLGGIGTVGGLSVGSGGIVAPGNSIGTLTVNGNASFAPGSTYRVEINPAGQSDLLAVTGTATLNGGTVGLTKAPGLYAPGTRYTILTANGGVSGAFAGLTQDMPFVDLALGYDPSDVYLDIVRNTVPFPAVGVTRNEIATAAAVEALGTGNPVYDAVVGQPTVAGARQAFNALSGEIYASAQGVMLDDSRYIREAVGDRLRQGLTPEAGALAALAPTGPALAYAPAPVIKGPLGKDEAQVPAVLAPAYALWGEGFGAWGRRGSDGNAAGLDTSVGGFVLGADAPVGDQFRVGVAGGYSRTSIDGNAGSSADLDTYYAALYGGGQWGPLGIRLGAAYSWHDLDATRAVVFPGFGETLKGSQDANTTQAFGEIGYRLALGGVALEPFAGLAYVNLETDAFTEAGGAAGLTGFSGSEAVTFTSLGVRAAQRFALGATTALTLRGTLGWQHAFGDTTPTAALAFTGASLPFTVAGVPIAEDALVVKAGADLAIGPAVTLGVAYSAQFAQDAQDQQLKGVLNVRF